MKTTAPAAASPQASPQAAGVTSRKAQPKIESRRRGIAITIRGRVIFRGSDYDQAYCFLDGWYGRADGETKRLMTQRFIARAEGR